MGALVLAVLAGALIGCAPPPPPRLQPPPASLEDGWQRRGYARTSVSAAPELIRALGARDALGAAYVRDPAGVRVEAYLMPAEAAAFEARQKFQQQPGQLAFHNGAVFAVCTSTGLDPKSLIAFSRALESAWFKRSP
jgi:hypothetical protein